MTRRYLQIQPLTIFVAAPVDHLQDLAMERMKRVRDAGSMRVTRHNRGIVRRFQTAPIELSSPPMNSSRNSPRWYLCHACT